MRFLFGIKLFLLLVCIYIINISFVGVVAEDVQSIHVSPNQIVLNIGDTATLNATITPSDLAVQWSSSNESVVSVSSNGIITAKSSGSAIVTVALNGNNIVKDNCLVVVLNTIESIGFNNENSSIPPAGWTIPATGGEALIATDVGKNGIGDNALRIVEHDGNWNTNFAISKSLTKSTGLVTLQYDIKSSGGIIFLYTLDSKNNTSALIRLNNNQLMMYNGATPVNMQITYGTWYAIKLVINTESKKYDVYVNSLKVQEGFSFHQAGGSDVSALKILVNETTVNGFLIDNITTYSSIPVISLPVVIGLTEMEQTLMAEYRFFDADGSANHSQVRWLASNSKDDFASARVLSTNSPSYVLTAQEVGKFIYAEVTPLNGSGVFGVKEVSEPVGPVKALPSAPEVFDVRIEGLAIENGTVRGVYTYFDVNDDAEAGSTYSWLVGNAANSPEDDWIEVKTGSCSALNIPSYTIDSNNLNKYIKFKITPKAANSPSIGKTVETAAQLIMGKPRAYDIQIKGEPKVGNIIYGDYYYEHPNKIFLEAQSTFRWIKNGVPTSITTKAYEVTSTDVGKELIFEVTPKTTVEPTTGEPQRSAPVVATDNSTNRDVHIKVSSAQSSGRGTFIKPIEPTTSLPSSELEQNIQFIDIEGHWAKQDIEKMLQTGIIKGLKDNMFEPDEKVSRAQFITMIVRALELDRIAENITFNDVKDNEWYYKPITTASSVGLISGFGGFFRPHDSITRQEISKILVEAYRWKFNKEPLKEEISTFEDSNEISPWAIDYMKAAKGLSLIKGITSNRLSPKETASRAEAVTMIKRFMDQR